MQTLRLSLTSARGAPLGQVTAARKGKRNREREREGKLRLALKEDISETGSRIETR